MIFYREYFLANDSKKSTDDRRKAQATSGPSNADLITNHLNETTAAAASKNASGGTPQ